MPKVFISFDYKDMDAKKVVDNWVNQGMGKDISFSSIEGHDYLPDGTVKLKKILREAINQSQVVLVLVGDNTHNRPWVDHEVHHAKCQQVKVIWTQLPGTRGAQPKEIRNIGVTPFKMNLVQDAIRGIFK